METKINVESVRNYKRNGKTWKAQNRNTRGDTQETRDTEARDIVYMKLSGIQLKAQKDCIVEHGSRSTT